MKSIHKALLTLSSLALLVSCGGTQQSSSGIVSSQQATSQAASASSSDASKPEGTSVDSSPEAISIVSSSEESKQSQENSSDEVLSSVESSNPEESYTSVESAAESVESSAEPSESEVESSELSVEPEQSSAESQDTSEEESSFSITTKDGSYSKSGRVYTISAYGTYTLAGTLQGQIYVDVPESDSGDNDVELDLNGVEISYDENSPIYIKSADKVKIKAVKKTTNTITDLRSLETEEDETQGNGAIYAKADLNLIGPGTLNVVGSYNNGVHTTKDLKIKKETLTVTAPNNALKGNNSITIISGNITAISTGGDGLKTTDSEISSSTGKQRGTVTISGGTVNIYAACDGIDAAYDTIIQEGVDEDDSSVTTVPTVNIKTNKFSSYTGDIVSSSEETLYLRTTASNSSSYRYSVYFYNDSLDDGVWRDATYKNSSGGRTTYYYYQLDRPTSYSSFMLFKFRSSSENSLTDYVAKSSGNTVNTNYDCLTFTASSSNISIDRWSTYGASGGQGGGPGGGGPGGGPGWDQGNTDKAEDSTKGIKSANSVQISGGIIDIEAHDDGLHANYGESLDNGSQGVGDVLISGGNTTIYASDDGLHADRYLRISGGELKVTHAYEGLEGNQIYISGGTTQVFGTDDGVNAGNSSGMAGLSPSVNISGGYLFCAVPSNGDTDGIDSNGSISITGGTVITCGPNSGMASALDADGSVSLSNATLIVFGGVEKNPSTSLTKSTISGSHGNGNTYTITFSNGETVQTKAFPSYNYSGGYTWSVNGSMRSVQ